MRQQIIIRNDEGFWDGSSWTDDYNDAIQYNSEKVAIKTAEILDADAIINYGYNNEEIL